MILIALAIITALIIIYKKRKRLDTFDIVWSMFGTIMFSLITILLASTIVMSVSFATFMNINEEVIDIGIDNKVVEVVQDNGSYNWYMFHIGDNEEYTIIDKNEVDLHISETDGNYIVCSEYRMKPWCKYLLFCFETDKAEMYINSDSMGGIVKVEEL